MKKVYLNITPQSNDAFRTIISPCCKKAAMMKHVQYQNMTYLNLHDMYPQQGTLKLASSASEQNVYFNYVCLVNDLNSNNLSKQRPSYRYVDGDLEEIDQEQPPIKVERSKALHELIESHRHDLDLGNEASTAHQTSTSYDESEPSETENIMNFDTANPNVLKLTKMKWLTEEQQGSPNSSSPSMSPTMSSTSICSRESYDHLSQTSVGDKYLSTILRLDREHNMFGLSNIAIVGARPSKKMKKENEKPVFPQTAIVQVCCMQGCCRHRSNTDLPSSLKCRPCISCCVEPAVSPCPWPVCCPSCESVPCSCPPELPIIPSKCFEDCGTCCGMKVTVHRKPKFEPVEVELTPRSSSILHKPLAARSCHHLPRCIPPSSCFPYLMPCYWPARPSAPCSVPARCFHNPPCLAPRKKRPPGSNMPEKCPPGICNSEKTKCQNLLCPGKMPNLQKELERFT